MNRRRALLSHSLSSAKIITEEITGQLPVHQQFHANGFPGDRTLFEEILSEDIVNGTIELRTGTDL